MPEREPVVAPFLVAKRAASRGAALIIAVGALFSESALAQLADSSWPIFRRDAQLTARAQANGPIIPAVKWTARFGNGRLGAPAIGLDGTIYVPGVVDSALYAVAPDGQLRWIFAGTRREEFASSPVVGQDGTIYFGSSKHIFYAVNPNGTERWRLTLGGEVRVSANIGSDGTIYVAAWDNKLYAITPEGKIKWIADLKGRRSRNGPAIASDGTIYVIADEYLMAFSPDGAFKFEHDCRDISVLSGLMVEGKETVYVTALTTAKIKAISTGNVERWKTFFPNDFGPAMMPALGTDGSIYFGSVQKGGIFALNHDGSTRWTFSLPGTENLTELALDAANNVYIVNDSLGLMSLDGANGKLRWNLDSVRCAYSPAFGKDGTIYIASDKKLYAVGPQTPFAARLIIVSGDSQSVCIEPTLLPSLPIKAKVLDQYGNPFPNQPVNFLVLAGGGSVNSPRVSTGNDGFAQTAWTLGNQPGVQELEVSSDSLAGSPDTLIAIAKVPKIGGEPVVLFDPTEIKHASEKVYVIRNDSDCPLRIDSMKVVAGASIFFLLEKNPPVGIPFVIPPHGSVTVRLQFAPTDCGTHTAALCIYSNDPVQPEFCVPLRGAALQQPDIEAANDSLGFSTVCVTTGDTLAFPVFNLGCAPLTISNVASSNPAFRVISPLPIVVPLGSQVNLQIEFKPAAISSYNGTLSIFSNDPDENPATVAVSGSGGDVDIAGATEVNFDPVEVQICSGNANSSTRFYSIHNPGFCDLVVNLPDTIGVFTVSPHGQQIIKPGETLRVELKFTPSKVDNFVETLRITNNVPNKSPLLVALNGRGIAAPAIALTPKDTLDFEKIPVGASKRLPVTIKNLGAERLSVDSLVIKSKFFATESLEFSLDCNDSMKVDVAFMPPRQGTFTDSLLIYSNDPDGNASKRNMLVMVALGENEKFATRFGPTAGYKDAGPASIFSSATEQKPAVLYLRGSGSGPEIEVEPDSLDFGAVCGGQDSLKFVNVMNEGDETLQVDSLAFLPPVFFTTQTTPFSVPPKGSVRIPVRYTYVERREDSGTLTLFSNDPDEPAVSVALHGIGKAPDIELVTPDTVTVCLGSVTPTPICVFNPSDCDLPFDTDSIEIFISSGRAALSKTMERLEPTLTKMAPINIPPKGKFCLNVNVRGQQLSNLTIEVFVKSNIPGKKLITRSIPVNVVPAAIAGVQKVDFDSVKIMTVSEKPAQVWNPSECVVRIDTLRITGMDSAAFAIGTFPLPYTINAGEKAGVPVIFKPTRIGRHTAKLLVSNNDPDPSRNPLPIILIGVGTDTTGPCDDPPQIAVNPDSLLFGDVPVGNPVSQNLTIRNTGCDTLRVTDVRNNLPAIFFVNATDQKFNLARGETRVVPVFFAPAAKESYFDTLRIVSNDTSKGTVLVPLNGRGTKVDSTGIAVDPESVPFGTVCINEDSTRFVKICNTGTKNLRAITISTGTPQFKVEPVNDLLIPTTPDSCRTLTVTFSPTTVGNFQDTVTVVWDSSLNLPPLKIPLSGIGIGPRIAGTDTLRFGHIIERTSLKKFAKVCNVAGCELVISALKIAGKDSLAFSANASGLPLTLAPDECDSIEVTFTPPNPGRFVATLLVYNNDTAYNPFEIVLLGEGDECNAAISVTPASLPFGEVVLGDTLAKTLKVMNTSECETLRVSKVVANTPKVYFVNLADRQFDLAPGASRDIKVYFAPAAVIFYGDSLMITSDDPSKSLVGVPLSGNGKSPFTVTPDSLSFGQVCLDDDSSIKVKICNNSNVAWTSVSIMFLQKQPGFTFDPTSRIDFPAHSCTDTLRVNFAPKKIGVVRDTLEIIWVSAENTNLHVPPMLIPLSGEGVGPQIAGEKEVRFDTTGVSKSDTMHYTIRNEGPCELRIERLTITGTKADEFQRLVPPNTPYTIAPNATSELTLVFTPRAVGERRAQLNISNNDPDTSDSLFVVQLIGNAVTGVLAACESIDFGKTCADKPLTKECIITNTSKIADLEIDSLSLASGRDFHLGSLSWPIRLKPDSSIAISIIFAPEKTGDKRDAEDAVLISTKFSQQKRRIPLFGHKRSEYPNIVLNTSFLEFQSPVGVKTNCQATEITNEGCSPLEVSDLKLAGYTNVFEICPGLQTPFKLKLGDFPMPVDVLFKPINFKEFNDELRIYNDDPDKNPATVALVGRVPVDSGICLDLDSTEVRFGRVYRNRSVTVPFGIKNCTIPGALLTVKVLPLKLKDFTVAPDFVPNLTPPDSSRDSRVFINITFSPDSTGERVDKLHLLVKSVFGDHPDTTYEVTLRGFGIDDEVYALPNAFTPNDDDKNDFAKIHFPGYKMLSPVLRIYDLRGIAVRVLRRPNDRGDIIAWDGYDGEGRSRLMPPGAYVWLLEDQGKKVGSGVIVLIR